jgi:hypothetical protein
MTGNLFAVEKAKGSRHKYVSTIFDCHPFTTNMDG